MSKKTTVYVIGILLLFVIGSLVFIKMSNSSKNKIVGLWDVDGNTKYEFDKNGSGRIIVPMSEYEFTYKATSFVPRCITQLNDMGITSIGTESEALEGDIWLVGKQGIILRYVDDAIRVDIVGEPLFKFEDENFDPPTFVQTINGMESDEYGNFKITVLDPKDILRVENSADGITIYAAGV